MDNSPPNNTVPKEPHKKMKLKLMISKPLNFLLSVRVFSRKSKINTDVFKLNHICFSPKEIKQNTMIMTKHLIKIKHWMSKVAACQIYHHHYHRKIVEEHIDQTFQLEIQLQTY